jgi:hypothetical protein
VGDQAVEDGVGDLIGQLVRMAHRYGFRRKEIACPGLVLRHDFPPR